MISFGIKPKDIKTCAKTGLTVDIHGTAKKQLGSVNAIALRADMDALPIPENNPHLNYKSMTDHAHMCGHDGHTTILLAVAKVL